MKRKRTQNEMQNITSFFAKKNHTSTSLPHPTQNEQTISPPQQSEQTTSPPQESEQHSSPSNYSTQNSPQNEQGQCSPNAPIFGERLSEHEFANLPQDPGKRRKMSQFHKDDRDLVRRIYIQRKPCQPKDFIFPQTSIFGKNRRFCAKWFDTWTWLEYSVEKDAAYCFPCYLFKDENAFGGDAFVSDGFKSWNRSDLIRKHVGNDEMRKKNLKKKLDGLKSQYPHFKSIMCPSHVRNKYTLSVPFNSHASTYFPSDKSEKIILKGPTGKNHAVGYYLGKKHAQLLSGWKHFVWDNHLKVGDACMFELVSRKPNFYKVSIHRG